MKARVPTALFWVFVILPWTFWYAAIKYRAHWVRTSKDPALYDGLCWRTWRHSVSCSLDTWLGWEPHPGIVGVLTFFGALIAVAISGAIALYLRGNLKRNP